MKSNSVPENTKPAIRCAPYGRQSVSDGEQEHSSLTSQREAAEAYIASQRDEGWECVPTVYEDAGCSGGHLERPGLKRLMTDVEDGKIDCVLVYKVDRFSRSLPDFLALMAVFIRCGVMFVSVTQAFNTATSMGRLIINVLLSFAQFERELISDRTRDNMAAARRKGYWLGGFPVLGYRVRQKRLVVDDQEAQIVRQIFALYLDLGGLLPVVQELERRGWRNKLSTAIDGRQLGGKPFCKSSVHRLLTNVTYMGSTKYRQEIHEGQHEPIIDRETWQRTQDMLAQNGRTGGVAVRNKFAALLKGLVYCKACGCAMSPTHSKKSETKRYRYCRCQSAQQRGQGTCPFPSVSAGQIESVVVDQIRRISAEPELIALALQPLNVQADSQIDFDSVWDTLTPLNQVRLVQLIVQRVDFDGAAGKVQVTFHPAGIQS